MSALAGIRVLDFTHYIAGPYCSQILADHGADVIKIERLDGEVGRQAMPHYKEDSLYFASQNRNKRAMALDLKAPQSLEIINRLIESADILVTNYAAGVPEKLGFGYERISSINPRIIMVQITGFGLTGPYRDYVAFDGVIQAMSGLASLTGDAEGPPTNVGYYIADHNAGMQGAMGALLAVYNRERTGKGQYVDISMLDGMVSMLGYYPGSVLLTGQNPSRQGTRDRFAYSNTYPAKDGSIYIAPTSQVMWEKFARLIGHDDWADSHSPFYTRQARMENREQLDKLISEWTVLHTKDEIFHLMQQEKIPCGPVHTMTDLVQDPQVKERAMIQTVNTPDSGEVPVPGIPIKLSQTPAEVKAEAGPPRIGQHTRDILTEIGFTREEVEELRTAGVV
jgi:CoA:oxalate CoA-transferase